MQDGLGEDVSAILNPRAVMTVFAPSDAAFAAAGWLSASALPSDVDARNPGVPVDNTTAPSLPPLASLARNHIILGDTLSRSAFSPASGPPQPLPVTAESGRTLTLSANATAVVSIAAEHTAALVQAVDREGCAAIVYIVDQLLW